MPSEKRKVGDICENIAVKHLVKHNHEIVSRNYSRKWGEIDIVSRENVSLETPLLHFIEVKGHVSRESESNLVNPEDNVHSWKKKRLWRAIQTWLAENDVPEDVDWQVDVMAVFLDPETGESRIRWTKNIILGE
jgi:putative endonuclease